MPETYEGQSLDILDRAIESLRDNPEVRVNGIRINGYLVSMRVRGEQIRVDVTDPSDKSGQSNIFVFADKDDFREALERAGKWVREYIRPVA